MSEYPRNELATFGETNKYSSIYQIGSFFGNQKVYSCFRNFDTNLSSDPTLWLPFYDAQTVEEALKNIKLIAFKETVVRINDICLLFLSTVLPRSQGDSILFVSPILSNFCERFNLLF